MGKVKMSMFWMMVVCLVAGGLAVDPELDSSAEEEARGKEYMKELNTRTSKNSNEASLSEWNYQSNITTENLEHKLKVGSEIAKRTKEMWLDTVKFNWRQFKDPDLRRQFKKYSLLGSAALPDDEYTEYQKLISSMSSTYSQAQICDFKNKSKCDLKLEPEISQLLTKSRDPAELAHVWVEWRKETGEKVRPTWEKYVALSNKAAKLNNLTDNAEFWLVDYETEDFPDHIEKLWKQLKPLYVQFHAYVRRRLRETYGESEVSARGPIPAHLFGNMWAQSWSNIYDFTLPFPGRANIDVTDEMVKQGYTPDKMFRLSEEFFTSLNLSKMPDLFWERSILAKPQDGREMVCHASAWDFYDSKDFRIKQCSVITMENLKVAHHEMGHIQYFLQYKDLPRIYRRGANPGFHEAVGDVLALSVATPKHLKKINLLTTDPSQSAYKDEETINFLYLQGLAKIAFLPYGFMLDQYRWNVFKEITPPRHYNCDYWRLRQQFQGVEPPVDRSEQDFDAGGKYHVIASVPYIRYFVSFVIQFQFHRALCIKAGEYDPNNPATKPLHECDIYQSKEAGEALGKMLQMGSSKPWPDAMEAVTGQREMDASGLLEYFQPLRKWLEEDNKKHNEFLGWETTDKRCTKKRSDLIQPVPPVASSASKLRN